MFSALNFVTLLGTQLFYTNTKRVAI